MHRLICLFLFDEHLAYSYTLLVSVQLFYILHLGQLSNNLFYIHFFLNLNLILFHTLSTPPLLGGFETRDSRLAQTKGGGFTDET